VAERKRTKNRDQRGYRRGRNPVSAHCALVEYKRQYASMLRAAVGLNSLPSFPLEGQTSDIE